MIIWLFAAAVWLLLSALLVGVPPALFAPFAPGFGVVVPATTDSTLNREYMGMHSVSVLSVAAEFPLPAASGAALAVSPAAAFAPPTSDEAVVFGASNTLFAIGASDRKKTTSPSLMVSTATGRLDEASAAEQQSEKLIAANAKTKLGGDPHRQIDLDVTEHDGVRGSALSARELIIIILD